MKKFYSMLALVSVSLLVLFSTNSYSQAYDVRMTNQTFSSLTKTISFPGTTPNANGNGTFTLIYWDGDLDGTGTNLENLVISGETGPSIGNTLPTGQCSAIRDSVVITIPMADINAWAATGGTIDMLLTANSNVNITLCTGSLTVDAHLTYPVSTVPNDAGASTFTPTIVCPGTSPVTVQVNNYGTNQIDSVWLNWSRNGVLQTPIQITSLLDTTGGTGTTSVTVALGTQTFTAGVTDVYKAWTSMPNGTADTTISNDTIVANIKPALTGTFTIGGTSPDYLTFAAAIADLNTIGLCGPVVFNVRQGTYTEQVDLGAFVGSSPTNIVTFQADPANTAAAIITHSASATADNYVVKFSGAENVIFDSLTISATGSTYAYSVVFASAENVTIRNCEINASSTSTSSLSTAVRNETGVNVENCTLENNTINYGYYGIYWYGGNTTTKEVGNVIRGNDVKDFRNYGIYFYYQAGGVIEGNNIEQVANSTSFSYGMYTYYTDSIKIKANSVILTGTSTNYGLYLYRSHGSATDKSEVQNNMIVTSPTSTGTSYGIYLGYGQHLNIYHNSVNVRGGSATAGRGIYLLGSTSTLYGNVNIRNNIFTNSGLGNAMYINTGATSPSFLDAMDYNIYNAASGDLISLNGTIHTTMASYIAASNLDSNSFDAIPGFFSSTDLHLQGGVAADAGANTGVMVDFDGDARPLLPSTGYDIGADEYIPPTCPMGYGLTAFNLTSTSADVTWTKGINDVSWIFEYGTPGFTPGTGTSLVSANDTATITGLNPTTDYCVYVRGVCSAGDTSLYFGPYCFKTRCVSSLSGVYTINSALPTAGVNFASFGDAIAALNNCGVSGPTTFNVNQGTYTEQIVVNNIVGASTVNTITFQGDPTNTAAAILTYAATGAADNYVVSFDGAEHIIINNLTLTAGGLAYSYVIYFPTTAYNVVIKNSELNGSSGSTSTNATVIYDATGTTNLIENVTIDSNDINDGSYALYMRGGGTTTKEKGLKITNNNITGFSYYGTYFYYQDSILIENNNMEQSPTATSFCYGLYTYYLDNAKVSRNRVVLHNTTTNYGMYVGRYAGLDNEVSNNMIITSENCLPTNTAYGMYVNYALNTRIYHNTINVREGSPTGSRALYVTGSTSSLYGNVDIRNNIFVNSAGGYASYVLSGASTTFLSHLDYNIYHTTGTNAINFNNTNYTSFAAYQTATLRDSNSYMSTPQFVAPDDLHLVGVVAYDNGDPTLGIMTDIDGDVRPLAPSTGYDIGADEYIPPSCPSPYAMALDTVTTTSATLSWLNGPADSIWEIQYGTTGFVLGSGTTINSNSNPTVLSGLTASTCYEVWIRSICTVGDTSLWSGPFNFCSRCAPVADYCTDFENDAVGSVPFCWNSFVSSTSANALVETRSSTFTAYSGANYVYMTNSNDASATMMLIAPEVSNLSAGTHRANFWMRADTTVVIGTISNLTNPTGTFTPIDTLDGLDRSTWINYKVAFDTYTGTDTYVGFLFTPHTTYDYVYLDDFCWEAIPSCEKAPAVTILNAGVDSTTINVGWNNDSTHVSYVINYGPAGYDPITNPTGGQTTTSAFNFAAVNGLRPLTEYCFWVKAICTNGDTSFWAGPYCGSTGCPSGVSLPYFEDFTDYRSVFPTDETPQCWDEATGGLTASGTVGVAESQWEPDGFSNVGSTGAARINFSAFGTREGWLLTPRFALGTDVGQPRFIEFDISLTDDFSTAAAPNGFGSDDTVAFVISYDGGVTWKNTDILMQWDTNNEPGVTATHVTYTLRNTAGNVRFGFYGSSSIGNEGVDFFVDNFSIKDTVFAGVEEVSFNENFKVFPNPNNGEFTILNEGSAQKSNIKLLDIQGRVVYDNQFYFNENARKQIEVSKLKSGVYILLLQSEGKQEQHRIVIE